jgi:hypothetical protein
MSSADRWSVLKDDLPLPPAAIPPTTIFKYRPISKYSLKNLAERAIYFNSPRNFNDPFDCAINAEPDEPTAAGLEAIRRALVERAGSRASAELASFSEDELRERLLRISWENFRDAKAQFLRRRGVACFAEDRDNLLMWAHFADSFRGCCLEFQTRFKPLVSMDASELINLLFFTKCGRWGYEQEWRGFSNAGSSIHYSPYALNAVYFGPRVDNYRREEVRSELGVSRSYVECWQGKLSEDGFAIRFEQLPQVEDWPPILA